MSTGVMARQSTSVILDVGPILDSTGAEFTTAVIADLTLSKNGSRAAMSGNTFTHAGNGHYSLTLTTANTDTLGVIQISCNRATYQMPVKERQIVPAAVYDAIVLGTDVLAADVIQIGGDAQSGTDLKDFVDAGYDPTTNKVNAELDSASLAQFVTFDTGQTTAAAGSVAKLSQGSGGSGSVTVLPATGIVANRSAGVTLLPVIGETISQAITVYQSDGTTAVNLSGKTLNIIFETMSGADVAVVQNADITISGTSSNVVTFAYPSTVTASERTLRFAIRDASAPKTMYLQGVCSVVRAPQVDA